MARGKRRLAAWLGDGQDGQDRSPADDPGGRGQGDPSGATLAQHGGQTGEHAGQRQEGESQEGGPIASAQARRQVRLAVLLSHRGILSQTLSNEAGVELVLFAFAAGEQLSEHTSARPAIIHILSGEGELTVAGDTFPAGTWARMAPDTKHALVARSAIVMAPYLLPG